MAGRKPGSKPKSTKNIGKRKQVIAQRLKPEEYEFCTKLAQRIPVAAASRELWGNDTYGYIVLRRPQVARYLEKLKVKVEQKEIERTAKKIADMQTVGRAEVFSRMAELMNMPPDITNDNISGQVKAGEALAKILGMMVERTADVTKMFEGKTEQELEYFAVHGEWPNRVDESQPV